MIKKIERGKSRIPDINLLNYCKTDNQREIISLWCDLNKQALVAEKLGKAPSTIRDSIERVIHSAAKSGYETSRDLTDYVRPGMAIKGESILLDSQTGEEKLRWVKTDKDKEKEEELLNAWIESLCETVKKYKLPKAKNQKQCMKDLLTIYPLGDPHLGMYAWHEEAGEDFDCDIAERQLRSAIAYLIDISEPSETAIILNLGDFFHRDDDSNRTKRSGNELDADGRWARVLDIGTAIMCDSVMLALQKHKNVIVKNVIGNHDDNTSKALATSMKYIFRDNKRVEIACASDPFFTYEFGLCSIFASHGHMFKMQKAQGIISNYFPELWGRTKYRYYYQGHLHHELKQEENGLIGEIFNTLASPDAWHYGSGYGSHRNMKSITIHKDFGEVGRQVFDIRRTMTL